MLFTTHHDTRVHLKTELDKESVVCAVWNQSCRFTFQNSPLPLRPANHRSHYSILQRTSSCFIIETASEREHGHYALLKRTHGRCWLAKSQLTQDPKRETFSVCVLSNAKFKRMYKCWSRFETVLYSIYHILIQRPKNTIHTNHLLIMSYHACLVPS
ncbi:hypothetical protein B0F90DRAFT_1143914 [Multifurca ochricompacta]|uniref:Uncharacterized protein n=1 Tax=Multifurca ochricompacta TaxID=376703 RepID=A0AAD4LYW2_9AGAM|nr:hypothetical protein B0F90DRAFT_1143914 [Multifurca ochricompacta]